MRELGPKAVYDLMQDDPEYIYLDVRSVPEYEAGHPARSINIPLLHFTPGLGMSPNEDFPAVVEANLPKDAKLVIGCKTGGRSARACSILEEMGYQNLANVKGGFAGVSDNFGRQIEPGWSTLGLPLCSDCGPDSTYESLSARKKS